MNEMNRVNIESYYNNLIIAIYIYLFLQIYMYFILPFISNNVYNISYWMIILGGIEQTSTENSYNT